MNSCLVLTAAFTEHNENSKLRTASSIRAVRRNQVAFWFDAPAPPDFFELRRERPAISLNVALVFGITALKGHASLIVADVPNSLHLIGRQLNGRKRCQFLDF